MIDLLLDEENHDLVIRDGDLVLVSGVDELKQSIKIAFLFFRREWMLDTSEGFLDTETMYAKNPNVDEIDARAKAVLLERSEVTSIDTFTSTFDSSTRKYTIAATISTVYGKVTI